MREAAENCTVCRLDILFLKFPEHSMNFTLFSNIICPTQLGRVLMAPMLSLPVPFSLSIPPRCGSFQHLPNLPPCQRFNANFCTKWSLGAVDSVDLWFADLVLQLQLTPIIYIAFLDSLILSRLPNYILSSSRSVIVSLAYHLSPSLLNSMFSTQEGSSQ